MTKKQYNPAFPCKEFIDSFVGFEYYPGMSLRQWYAGKALSGYLASFAVEGQDMPEADHTAKIAYEYADAMIALGEE